MRRNMLFLPLVLGMALLTASPAHTAAAGKKGKKNQAKLKQARLLPAIKAQFLIPQRLKPTKDQKKQMAQIRAEYGGKLQLLTGYLFQLKRIRTAMNSQGNLLGKTSSSIRYAPVKIPGLGYSANKGQRKGTAEQRKQVDALLKQYGSQKKELESEIRKQIDNILTPEQKTELAKMKAEQATKRKATKKKAAKGK